MPELPEVETTRRGLAPLLRGRRIVGLELRCHKLRWEIDPHWGEQLAGEQISTVERRAKYLIIHCGKGWLILHLGMSGHLRVVPADTPPGRHDHVDLVLEDGQCLRFNDPRRFGALIWTDQEPRLHPLLAKLGPEPLGEDLSADSLYWKSRGRRTAVKPFIMNQQLVVGVGNIYASEALFRAGIRPSKAAGQVSRPAYQRLVTQIRAVLAEAIEAGGTTISDFRGSDGKPGYFEQNLLVYGRNGEACRRCGRPIRVMRLGQRSTYYCPSCQK